MTPQHPVSGFNPPPDGRTAGTTTTERPPAETVDAGLVPQPQPPIASFAPPPPAYPAQISPASVPPAWQGGAPVAPTKKKAGVIIAAAVAGVAVIGGAIGLIGLTQAGAEPVDGSDVAAPAPDPGPTPPTVPVVTTPGPQPPPTVPAPQPEPAPTPEPEPTPLSGGQAVFDRIAVGVPEGWEVTTAEEGVVVLSTTGAELAVVAQPVQSDAESLVRSWVADPPGGLEAVTIGHMEAVNPPTSSVVSTFVAEYTAILPTHQGSVPVEALVIAFVTQDGIGVLVETFNEAGAFDSYAGDYGAMVDSIIATL